MRENIWSFSIHIWKGDHFWLNDVDFCTQALQQQLICQNEGMVECLIYISPHKIK